MGNFFLNSGLGFALFWLHGERKLSNLNICYTSKENCNCIHIHKNPVFTKLVRQMYAGCGC